MKKPDVVAAAEPPLECVVGQRIKRYLRQLAPHQNEREGPQLLREALAEIEGALTVVEAARCIRHWHDSDNDGMVVSGEHVRALWQALHDLDEVPNV